MDLLCDTVCHDLQVRNVDPRKCNALQHINERALNVDSSMCNFNHLPLVIYN